MPKQTKDCDWCGSEYPTPAVVKVTLTDMDGVLLDCIVLCSSCAERPVRIIKQKELDSGD